MLRMLTIALMAGICVCLIMTLLPAVPGLADNPPPTDRDALKKLAADGNFNDAYEGFRALLLDSDKPPTPALLADDLRQAINCLNQLGRINEADALIEAAVTRHADNWHLLDEAATQYLQLPHDGFIIAGQFERGGHRGGGQVANVVERDRTRALQLRVQALPLVAQEPNASDSGYFHIRLAEAITFDRDNNNAWQLQSLTDLTTLPDPEEAGIWFRQNQGPPSAAPVDPDGNPILYTLPDTWDNASSDGQRWRWALAQAATVHPPLLNETLYIRAQFLHSQFGVQTLLTSFGGGFPTGPADDPLTGDGPYSLITLKEDETLARLATGIKRFTLPPEHNPITLYRQIADNPATGRGEDALESLYQIFANRQQFEKAAELLQRSQTTYGDPHGSKSARIAQIRDPLGTFESQLAQPAGRGAPLSFRFRNATAATFTARPIDIKKLTASVKAYLKSSPAQLDYAQLAIDDIASRFVNDKLADFLGPEVARWQLDLEPRPGHLDRVVEVTTPMTKAGAYLVEATLKDGNTSRIVVWLDDLAIVQKPADMKTWLYVADAATGAPVPDAQIQLFGYRQVQVGQTRTFRVDIKEATLQTGPKGQAIAQFDDQGYQWLITATSPQGRAAHLGLTRLFIARSNPDIYNQSRVYTVTDRPVYRPKDSVKYKLWIAQARFDQPANSPYAGQPFRVEIRNPRNDLVHEAEYKADPFGGMDGTLTLPADATLGNYSMTLWTPNPDPGQRRQLGGGTFRVEEYKKPEFEVTVEAPTAPVPLGGKIQATIKAAYYFGGPVTEARVHYTVTRTQETTRWYPPGPWDWLYGRGYLWLAPNSPWYPGWNNWGCLRPMPPWWFTPSAPPEVVADAEVPIGPDGTVSVEIDSSVAQAFFGSDKDQRYSITAEVTDLSRRTITGSGSVLASSSPLQVVTWLDRGHYRVGDTIQARAAVLTPDHKPAQGKGTLTLLAISYDDAGKPTEAPVQTWDVQTNADGQILQLIKASAPGQYRLAAKIQNDAGQSAEGGYLFVITGEGFDSAAFRFNDLELIPDKPTYAPGDTARLLINTNRPGSTVQVFSRVKGQAYPMPLSVKVAGKSIYVDLKIESGDMPNIFVEAITISDGRLHTQVCELLVPPESRVIDVAVQPDSPDYRPGQEAAIKLKLTGPDGKPVTGSTVLTVYDKAVEAISGGPGSPDIREFFWKYRREHRPQSQTSLGRWSGNLTRPDEPTLRPIGIFGDLFVSRPGVTTFNGDESRWFGEQDLRMKGGMGGMGGGYRGAQNFAFSRAAGMEMEMAAPAPMAMAAMADDAAGGAGMGGGGEAADNAPTPIIRTNFADTAFWAATLEADADGIVTVSVPLPESLTTWSIRAWSMGPGTRVGQGSAEIVTSKKLLVRLQAPRFFVETDEVVLSAIINNRLEEAKNVQALLEFDGDVLTPLDDPTQAVTVPSGGETRVDWRVKVAKDGTAVVRMKALADTESDALQMSFPAYIHGMLKTEAWSGTVQPGEKEGTVTVNVPEARRPADSRLVVRFSPTLAAAMVDALPYLVEYPYGCTEQTLNRFLPTVITQRTLQRMGLDLAAIRDKQANLNAQELGDPAKRAAQWKRFDRNPVYDIAEVNRMAAEGIQRLADMQLSDGGWGWFSGFGESSSAHTTAVVVHGLQTAQQNDLALPDGMLQRGLDWLARYQSNEVVKLANTTDPKKPQKSQVDQLDALVFHTLVTSDIRNDAMQAYLERDRAQLSPYAKTLLGLAFHKLGANDQLAAVLRNLDQFLVSDDANQTAYLKLPESFGWWHWYGSDTETQAHYLKLLAATDPKSERTRRVVKYLLNNRKHGGYWNSTRDTSYAVEALADFLTASGEDRPNMTVTIAVDGQQKSQVQITPETLFQTDNTLTLEGEDVTSGDHQITLTRSGDGPLYYNVYLTNFTKEDPITAAGLEIQVNRSIYRLIRDDTQTEVPGQRGQVGSQRTERYRREPLDPATPLKSGDLLEIELTIDSKNDYEYLIFEDYKAAGTEPVEVRSGYNGNAMRAYVEFRDERVAFFVRDLARGTHSVSYRLRAEIPGTFSALPARAAAMYAPELRANSHEAKLSITD